MRAEPIRKTSVDLILVEDLNEESSFVPVDLDSISRNLEPLYFMFRTVGPRDSCHFHLFRRPFATRARP
jgi:hypothetical protein